MTASSTHDGRRNGREGALLQGRRISLAPLSALCAFLSLAGVASAGWVSLDSGGPGVGLAETAGRLGRVRQSVSRAERVVLEATTPGFYRSRAGMGDGRTYDIVLAPGAAQMAEGGPDLPSLTQWIMVPNGTRPSLSVELGKPVAMEGFNVSPVQPPRFDSVDGRPPFTLDAAIYGRDADYPGVPAQLDPAVHLRGQEMRLLRIYPYQYNPVSQRLTVYPDMTVTVSFEGTGTSAPQRLRTPQSDQILRRTACNADTILALPPEPERAGGPSITSVGEGKFLIVCPPAFSNAANTLAQWRTGQGMLTYVATTNETGSTTNDIRDFIKNAYDTWSPAPEYVLLLGDVDAIPVWQVTQPSDLFYADMDDPFDHVADLGIGRWPVVSNSQAQACADRVIAYETDVFPASYYSNATLAAAFQDGEDFAPDHYADRRFAKTSEDLWSYFTTNDYNPERIYTTYNDFDASPVDPTHWCTNTPDYIFENDGGGGQPIPAELLRPGFAWDGGPSNIMDAIHAGSFLVTHRDHAGVTGWSAPAFHREHVDSLTNGNLRPVVWSVNCIAGAFDMDPTLCFCEHLIRHPTGGAIGVIGSTRDSFSGRNDRMVWGWMDAMWPDFIEFHGGSHGGSTPITRMGDVLSYGKVYMMGFFSWNDNTRTSIEEFHWLGDPTLRMWRAAPDRLDVSHPTVLDTPAGSIRVNVVQDGALVACSTSTELLGTATSSGGSADVTFTSYVAGRTDISVVVTKDGYLTYRGTATVTATGDGDVYVSLSGSNVPPYDTWLKAATNIQIGINTAKYDDVVLVNDGTYDVGSQVRIDGTVPYAHLVTLRSVHGAAATHIRATGMNRCLYMKKTHSEVDGFTLTNGWTSNKGGGAWIEERGTIRNCVIQGNRAVGTGPDDGGGGVGLSQSGAAAFGLLEDCVVRGNISSNVGGGVAVFVVGQVRDCVIEDNWSDDHGGGLHINQGGYATRCTIRDNETEASGGGVRILYSGSVSHSVISNNTAGIRGGGAYLRTGTGAGVVNNSRLDHCTIVANSAGDDGGGVYLYGYYVGTCRLRNSLVTENTAQGDGDGGGVFCFRGGTVEACTVVGNSADNGGGLYCDRGGSVSDTISYFNAAASNLNVATEGSGMAFTNCCSSPQQSGPGNITGYPDFISLSQRNYRLRYDSNCIGTGLELPWMAGEEDLDGNPRVDVTTSNVDIGAYEVVYGSGQPVVTVTNDDHTVLHSSAFASVGGTNSIHVVGTMSWTNALNGSNGTFAASASWVAGSVPLGVGFNTITVRGTNTPGESSSDSVTIYRQGDGSGTPQLDITNGNQDVGFMVFAVDLTVSNNVHVIGWLTWTNPVTSDGGRLLSEPWVSLDSIPVSVGANAIQVTGTNAAGTEASDSVVIRRQPLTTYAATNGGHAYPYDSWADAATNIQDAVEAVSMDGTVYVSNGWYATGGAVIPGGSSKVENRVMADRAVRIESMNGPSNTWIVGAHDPLTGGYGTGAVRCAYLTLGAELIGFTLTNGWTSDTDPWWDRPGGGAYVLGGTISNCVVLGCRADGKGGGIYCTDTGRVFRTAILDCYTRSDGGGIFLNEDSLAVDCTVSGCYADFGGGIASEDGSSVRFCLVADNVATGSVPHSAGGGIKSSDDAGPIENCVILRNTSLRGGGVYVGQAGPVRSSLIADNTAEEGGGVHGGSWFETRCDNCTIANNSATEAGGGLLTWDDMWLTNCIVVGNAAPVAPAYTNKGDSSTDLFSFTCISPSNNMPLGEGCTDADPLFVDTNAGNYRLVGGSPCIDAGVAHPWMASASDLDSMPRVMGSAPDMGAYEENAGYDTPSVTITGAPAEVSFATLNLCLGGTNNRHVVGWMLWSNELNSAWGTMAAAPGWLAPGIPLDVGDNPLHVSGTNCLGVVATDSVHVVRSNGALHVSLSGSHTLPFATWSTASTTIQAAVEAAGVSGLVLVAEGDYSIGGAPTPGYALTNRVCLTNAITVRAVDRPESTRILGAGPCGAGAVRCAYLTSGASLLGFTLTDGHTLSDGGADPVYDRAGGGVLLDGGGLLSNCVVHGCESVMEGGGVEFMGGGTVMDSLVCSNRTAGLGGGASCSGGGLLERCEIRANSCTGGLAASGGGVYCGGAGTLRDCLIVGNSTGGDGGGVYAVGGGTLLGCTICDNVCTSDFTSGGGVYDGGGGLLQCTNTIIYYNSAPFGTNWSSWDIAELFGYCCTFPTNMIPGGEGCIESEPLFVDHAGGDYHLASNSPCIDTALGAGATARDVERRPRPLDGDADGSAVADIGASEFAHPGVDADGDCASDFAEIIAGTDPLSASSFLHFSEAPRHEPGGGIIVVWSSAWGRDYTLLRATNLMIGFGYTVNSNIPATPPMNTETDTTAIGTTLFYQIEVE